MRPPGLPMMSARNDFVFDYENGADGRIWAGFPQTFFGFAQRDPHKPLVHFCGSHTSMSSVEEELRNAFQKIDPSGPARQMSIFATDELFAWRTAQPHLPRRLPYGDQ